MTKKEEIVDKYLNKGNHLKSWLKIFLTYFVMLKI